jgi:hypothetical protein
MAVVLGSAGKWSDAETAARRAVEILDPPDAEPSLRLEAADAHQALGDALFGQKRSAEAKDEMRRARELRAAPSTARESPPR